MKKLYQNLAVFVLLVAAWLPTLFFWFNNVDLSYLKSYFDLANPFSNLNLISVVRGHVLLQALSYLIFGFQPNGYYLIANILHALAVIIFYLFLRRLFENNKINFLLALLFGINISYADVLYEGSFNAYYPLLLILIILSALPFVDYLKSGFPAKANIKLLIIPGVLMSLGLLLRETVLVIPLIILLVIVVSARNFREIIKNLKYIVLPVIITAVYLVLRVRFLGELKSDLTDDAVQARMAFISGGRYLDWVELSLANFLRMLSEQVFPWARLVAQNLIFTLATGAASLIATAWVVWKIIAKGNPVVARIAKFGLGWFLAVNLFIAFVLPFPVADITAKSEIGATLSRYNYWGILGLVIIVGAGLAARKQLSRKLVTCLVLYVALNLVAIQVGGWNLYQIKHLPAKNFYQVILKRYPDFPKNTVIYYNFFQINNLRDYIGDLTYVFADKYYPGTHFDLETSLSYVEKEYLRGIPASSIFAFDLDREGRLIDKSDQVRQALSTLKDISLEPSLAPKLPENLYANFGYTLEFSLRAKGASITRSDKLCKDQTKAFADIAVKELLNYFERRSEFLRSAKVRTSSNYGDFPRFYFITANNLTDGQFGRESAWQANIGDNEQSITLDLGTPQAVNGLAWHSEGSYALPTTYTIYTSSDGVNWDQAAKVAGTNVVSRIDRFDKLVNARYVKMAVAATSLGQPVRLTEIEALNYSDYVLNNYPSWQSLNTDVGDLFCQLNSGQVPVNQQPGKVTWTTDRGTVGTWNLNFYLDQKWRRYSLPITNLEIYSNSLAILDEKMKSLEIIPGRLSLDYEVKDVKLVPKGE